MPLLRVVVIETPSITVTVQGCHHPLQIPNTFWASIIVNAIGERRTGELVSMLQLPT